MDCWNRGSKCSYFDFVFCPHKFCCVNKSRTWFLPHGTFRQNPTRSASASFPSFMSSELSQDNQKMIPRSVRKSSTTSLGRHLLMVAQEGSEVGDTFLRPAGVWRTTECPLKSCELDLVAITANGNLVTQMWCWVFLSKVVVGLVLKVWHGVLFAVSQKWSIVPVCVMCRVFRLLSPNFVSKKAQETAKQKKRGQQNKKHKNQKTTAAPIKISKKKKHLSLLSSKVKILRTNVCIVSVIVCCLAFCLCLSKLGD